MKSIHWPAFWKTFAAQFGFVFCTSLAWAIFNGWMENNWTLAGLIKNGGGAMVVIGTIAGYVTRAFKQVRDDGKHGDLIDRQAALEQHVKERLDASINRIESSEKAMVSHFERAAENLDQMVQKVVSYTTGGDSWMRLIMVEIEGDTLAKLVFFFEGDCPLYTIRVTVVDIIHFRRIVQEGDMSFLKSSDRYTKQWDSLAPKFSYPISTSIELSKTTVNRFRLNWNARNGSWGQDLEIRWLEGQWEYAIRNDARDGDPENTCSQGFPTDVDHEPIFSDLEVLAPVSVIRRR